MFELLIPQQALIVTSALALGAGAGGVRLVDWLRERRWAEEKRRFQMARAKSRGIALEPPRTKADAERELRATLVHDLRESATALPPPGVLAAEPRVPAQVRPESMAQSRPDAWTDPGRMPFEMPENTGERARTPGVQGGVQSRVQGSESRVLVFMSATDQAAAFLAFWRANKLGKCSETGKREDIKTAAAWVDAYRAWARQQAIGLVSQTAFLKELALQPGVEKDRKRVKDEHGRALRNAAGTPARPTTYAVSALEMARSHKNTPPAAKRKARDEILAGLEGGPPDETWAEAARRAA